MNILLSFFLKRKHKSLKKKKYQTYVSVELVLDGALIFPLYIIRLLLYFFWRKSTSPHYSNTKEDHKLQIEKV